jgi:hypothetical protein
MKIKGYILAIVTVIFSTMMAGCGMTNDEVIKEVDKCKKANMEPRVVMNLITYQIVNILCTPKE